MEETKVPVTNETLSDEVARVTRFLLSNGFTDVSLEALNVLAKLIVKNIQDENLVMRKEYAAITDEVDCDSLRSKLGYYIKKNYSAVKKSILEKYDYDMGDDCLGVKGFVEKIVIVIIYFVGKL